MPNRALPIGAVFCILITSAVTLAATTHVRWVTHKVADAELLSNDTEGLLIISDRRLAYEWSALQWVGQYILAWLRVPISAPTESQSDVVLVHITAAGVERATYRNVMTTSVRPVENAFYTYVNGVPMRINGVRLEPVSKEVGPMLAGHRGTAGWVRTTNILSRSGPETKITFRTVQREWTLIAHNNFHTRRTRAIDLQHGHEAPERLWSVDENPRYVSLEEYISFLR